MTATVIRGDDLARRSWRFSVVLDSLRLRVYTEESRPSKRHKWRVSAKWEMWAARGLAHPEQPDDVVAEARATLCAWVNALPLVRP